jgi:pimeloyl-ACP methyl ester carboxylesterase
VRASRERPARLFGGPGAPPRPRLTHTLGELRAFAGLPIRARRRRVTAPRPAPVDPAPVVVVPALLAGDLMTLALRRHLRRRGHPTYGWRLGVNLGPTRRALGGLEARVAEVARTHGRAVALVGHSMGGILARDLALRRPDLVRQVVTVCSPFRLPTRTLVAPIFHALSVAHQRLPATRVLAIGGRLPVPATALYSRIDGVVAWESCLEVESATSESIEITVPHGAAILHPSVIALVADRLAEPEGAWTRRFSSESAD